ncbi:Type II restriction enzyme, methylase subunit YeeA [Alkalibacterium sp. AK22]|uniref:DNA methyltransferase n=1 Tax=Alkalibacterium sp. AK22 TaxID=1229520 RepID=UPI00044F2D66|nr:DNA methyltransferase [Alkalibacterium sp. AK22]EXJ22642.1 Type II restriction enzyme, methylase subunit YeeA [Alkalibacterium sp. AK22]
MSHLTLDDLRNRALVFEKHHSNDADERQQAQSWIKDFLEGIFDIPKRKVNAGFEWRVKTESRQVYVDHLLNGVILIEMKSKGKSLDKAKSQAYQYVMKLKDEDIPQYVMLCDFEYIQLINLDNNHEIKFPVKELHKYIETFNFLTNKEIIVTTPQNPVNKEAAVLLEKLHHLLRKMNYPPNASTLIMTRLVFCLFADDTGIFEKNQFRQFLINNTAEDGSDLLDKLSNLFIVLNTPEEDRYQSKEFLGFRYINGGLFKVAIPSGISLTEEVRNMLLEVSKLDWSQISPIIFGSMFEGALNEKERHNLGAHYTSEVNIMKVVNSLFLDDLHDELESITKYKSGRLNRYLEFHDKVSNLNFLDPACGSGNFLILAYRELRRLENEVIRLIRVEEFLASNRNISSVSADELHYKDYQDTLFSVEDSIRVNVNNFYGIEIEPYAASIAKLGLWLMDHLMNIETSNKFSRYFVRLPLQTGAKIYTDNAMQLDWREVISPQKLNYIIGNPPFIGARLMSSEQKEELKKVFGDKKAGNLDYVAGWYHKAAIMMSYNGTIDAALVSTNSIVQGEQAALLWKDIFNRNISINFAHQTFNWDNEANVFVVIIGFSKLKKKDKYIFEYETLNGNPNSKKVSVINEYLLESSPLLLTKSSNQISSYQKMHFGSMANDGGNLILSSEEKNNIIKLHPELTPYIHPFIGSKELIRNEKRYIIYLKDAPLSLMRSNSEIKSRVEAVKAYRLSSRRKKTNELAEVPYLLGEDRVVKDTFLIIPRVSSIRREYIPMGFEEWPTIASDSAFVLPNSDLFIFGVLETRMHTLWLKTVGGKLKGDYRYSNSLVYNNFVFPEVTDEKKENIKKLASIMLKKRNDYLEKGNSLADLYDPLFMPIDLKKSHQLLDDAVERLYKTDGFDNDNERLEFIMKLYLKKRFDR